MAVDHNGYITLPKLNELQPEFAAVVANLVTALSQGFPELIHSIYVYGSVAEGRAMIGKSDLDITIVFNDKLDQVATTQLTIIQCELKKSHPVVSKIDFDCGVLQQVLHPDNQLSWGYWLKHHCVCIYGEDLSDRFHPFKPSKEIAVAVNGDFLSVIEKLIVQIQSSSDENKTQQLQRAAARKAIRATNILRSKHDTDWPGTLEEHCIKLNAQYPAKVEVMDYLLATSYKPQGDVTNFKNRIMVFANWLNAEFHN
ncbi:nucleotidyltransferase domain-containing protein [Serratia ficaria]|uniref:nucleotidyltransferase domain-containing protein n=1 Tax=Serratia ficaria TaxID=61651 RepID=UPI002ED5E702|nr:nucleotidyltransferase domain-containing protein [Serratia ficaria]